jgi:predicted short-subunit dehydrogenase-like oxidoreductase (DUF2520 family)
MRELERDSTSDTPSCSPLAVIGRGRLGTALSGVLRAAGIEVEGPLGRGADGAGAEIVLLCVPDAEIAAAGALVRPGRLVGHCSGAGTLDLLAPHEAFSLHPLMTVTAGGADFRDAGAAVAGTTSRAAAVAHELARRAGMVPIEVADGDRALYHAAASVASNFLVALEGAAEALAAEVELPRELLVPLVRATVENWASLGAERALTGPIARGDVETVARQREAIADRTPELLGLYDALAEHTRRLAAVTA